MVLNDCVRLGICGVYPGHPKPRVAGERVVRVNRLVRVRDDPNTSWRRLKVRSVVSIVGCNLSFLIIVDDVP